jgi:type II secretory pathway pseudopilin PulG
MFQSLKKFRKSKLGISLVEIVVAIGISTIALTTSAVFSTQLIYRSQENFMAESSSQLQNVIVEQLRLIEGDMINVVKNGGRPKAFASGTPDPWTGVFCTQGASVPLHYKISVPNVIDSNQNFTTQLSAQPITTDTQIAASIDGKQFQFYPLERTQLTGAFARLSDISRVVSVGIRKTEPVSGFTGIENPVLFEVVIRYYILNKTEPSYSEITEVRMVKSLVCP